jgi:hypothetical protein
MTWKPFTKDTQIKAGLLLKTRLGGEVYLVGNVNELLGVCDDCTAFAREHITEYADLVEICSELDGLTADGLTEGAIR